MCSYERVDSWPLPRIVRVTRIVAVSDSERRDEFAKAALTGLISRYSTLPAPKDVAAEVVRYADAVIAALDAADRRAMAEPDGRS